MKKELKMPSTLTNSHASSQYGANPVKEVPTTTVYMRPKIGLDTKEIVERGEIYTFENMNYKEENISSYKKSRVDKYMTLFIDFIR